MRRLYGRNAPWAAIAGVAASARSLKSKLSPDRTRDEEIQDRQSEFEWSRKHIFRPHQHFTYDPCSWSRTLEEKVKTKRRLSLVERLQMLKEREVTPTQPCDHAGKEEETEDSEQATLETDYFYSIQDTAPVGIPLQHMLERINALHVLLTAPRHANTALVMVERLKSEYRHILLLVFNRVRTAVVGDTLTFDALVYSWFLLMEGAETLLEALSEGKDDEQSTLHAVRTLRTALDTLLLGIDKHIKTPTEEALVLEGWIELLDVVTHPFTWRSSRVTMEHASLQPAPADATNSSLVCSIYERTICALAERMIASVTAGAKTEALDPQHLHALLCSITRSCLVNTDEAHLCRISLLMRKVADEVLLTIRGAIAPPFSHSIRFALLGARSQRAALETETLVHNDKDRQLHGRCGDVSGHRGRERAVYKPQAVVMDVCGPPRGIVNPPTAADDTLLITKACSILLRHVTCASVTTRLKASEAADTVLLLLSHVPNYDLSVGDTIDFACEVLQKDLPSVDGGVVEHQLRVLLLLSRLQFSMCDRGATLCNMFFLLCSTLTPPEDCELPMLREWKRLRGIVMHQLMHSVRVEELQQHCSSAPSFSCTWEECLAFGHYGGSLSLSFWDNACRARFSATTPLLPECARALIILRGRCKTNRSISSTSVNSHSTAAEPLDFDSVCHLARLLQVVLGGRVMADDLIVNPTVWDAAREATEGDEAVSVVLHGARLCVQDRHMASRFVTTFS